MSPDEFSTGQLWGNLTAISDKDGYGLNARKLQNLRYRSRLLRGLTHWKILVAIQQHQSGSKVLAMLFGTAWRIASKHHRRRPGFKDRLMKLSTSERQFGEMKISPAFFNPEDEKVDSLHLAPANLKAYTGTHDNNTVLAVSTRSMMDSWVHSLVRTVKNTNGAMLCLYSLFYIS